jgi:hypothetical protein
MKSFEKLSQKLNIPLVSFSDISTMNATQSDYGIVLDSNAFRSIFSRIKFLFFRQLWVKQHLDELRSKGVNVSKTLAVYPDVSSPLIVFTPDSSAASYCYENVLPRIDNSKKGLLKKVLFFIGKIHPSLDSFIFTVGESDKFEQISAMLDSSGYSNQASLICITTSNPVFLAFSDKTHPDYAIHNTQAGELKKRQEIYNVLGSLISKPVDEINSHEQTFFMESGLPGKPWFQLINSKQFSMIDIKERACNALISFKNKVESYENWNCAIDIQAVFFAQFAESHGLRNFSPEIEGFCQELSDITPKSTMVSGWQHGDFCINNLIFSNAETYIIDFEEFGDTLMPLQDELSLALSFYIQRSEQSFEFLEQDLAYCLKPVDKSLLPFMPMLFTFHLLFRLGQWGENPNRNYICNWLHNILQEYVSDPQRLFKSLPVQ